MNEFFFDSDICILDLNLKVWSYFIKKKQLKSYNHKSSNCKLNSSKIF